MQRLIERLKLRRNALNLTQEQLAEKAGVSERAIAAYESGTSQPTSRQMEKLARALGVEAGYFYGGDHGSELREQPEDIASMKQALQVLKSQAEAIQGQASALVDQIAVYERAIQKANSGIEGYARKAWDEAERRVDEQDGGAGGPKPPGEKQKRGGAEESSSKRAGRGPEGGSHQ